MLLTTTPTLQTHEIIDYLGPVFGEAVMGANVFRDFFAGLSDLAGGRAAGYEQVLSDSRTVALNELRRQASTLGATAVVGLRIDYSTVNNSMLMVCCSGTAVYCEQLPREEGGSGAQKEI
ncbi:MAG TPA: hypothetical protein DDW52_16000 [Planctomycetaceae bacterium]|nr:hypothetical protein [Planctomycetaceae bacterium]